MAGAGGCRGAGYSQWLGIILFSYLKRCKAGKIKGYGMSYNNRIGYAAQGQVQAGSFFNADDADKLMKHGRLPSYNANTNRFEAL